MSKAAQLRITAQWLVTGFSSLEKAAEQILLDCSYGFRHDHSGEEAAHRLVHNFHEASIGVVEHVLTDIHELPEEQQAYARAYIRDLQLLDATITALAHAEKIDVSLVRKAYDELKRLRDENPKVRAFYEGASVRAEALGPSGEEALKADRRTQDRRMEDRRTGADRRTT